MLDRLLETRRTHRKAPAPQPSIALDVAYRLQDELREALVARGEQVIGWKAGLTGRIAQEATGVHHPVRASYWATASMRPARAVPLSRFAELAVEVELAFVMKRDLAGPGVTPATALLAVEGALPALELVEFRWEGKPTGGDLIADGVAANAVVLGQPLTPVARARPRAGGRRLRDERPGHGDQHGRGGPRQSPERAGLAGEPPRGTGSRAPRRGSRDERLDLHAPPPEGGRCRDGALHASRVRQRPVRLISPDRPAAETEVVAKSRGAAPGAGGLPYSVVLTVNSESKVPEVTLDDNGEYVKAVFPGC